MPRFQISSDGRYVGTVGIDAMIDSLVESLGDDLPPEAAETMRSPEMLAQLEAVSGDYWGMWVEAWADRSLRQGAREADVATGTAPRAADDARFRAS